MGASPMDVPAADDALVRSGFPAHWKPMDRADAARLDWRAEGIDLPYVILITGRCGSTHLASMLAASGACGQPMEYFNEMYVPDLEEAARAHSIGEYIVHLARSRSSNGRFGMKIDHWRWERLRTFVDVDALFPRGRSAFFLMTRENIVAQAYSFATARATGIWHDHAEAPASSERSYLPSDAELLRELTLIALGESGLLRYLEESRRPAMRLTYEALMRDTEGVLRQVGEALGVGTVRWNRPAPTLSNVRRINYSRRDERMMEFRTRFASEIEFLAKRRQDFPYDAFRADVLKARGIDVAAWPEPEKS